MASPRTLCGLAFAGLAAAAALTTGLRHSGSPNLGRLRASITPSEITADGYEQAVLLLEPSGRNPGSAGPRISFVGDSRALRILAIEPTGKAWRIHLQAGILAGTAKLKADVAGFMPALTSLRLKLQDTDSALDGTPDFLRLDDEADRQAFRRWFTFLAELQYFTPKAQRPPEIVDCAALVRYAYREALRADRENWPALSHLALVPAIDPVGKYRYPETPLGPNLFRVRPGTFTSSDIASGAFEQFANAETLERYNTSFVSRDVMRALPGDLLFYQRPAEHMPFHTMIFLGNSQVTRDTGPFVVYDTGPDSTKSGQIRRLTLSQLVHYPDPQWQPVPTNPSFLGVFRWNILKRTL